MNRQPGDDISDDVARLRNAIACELNAQLGMRGETIVLADVPEVAYAVAVRLRYAFRIEWAPLWADDEGADDEGADDEGDDAPLGSDAAVFHASAMPDPDRTPDDRYPIFDHGWPRRL
jgi:hypothetical protein